MLPRPPGSTVFPYTTLFRSAGTVTETGTVAAMGVLLASVTTAPPAGAAAPSVTVPMLPAGPVTAAGLTLTPTSPATCGVNACEAQLPTQLEVAVLLTVITAA